MRFGRREVGGRLLPRWTFPAERLRQERIADPQGGLGSWALRRSADHVGGGALTITRKIENYGGDLPPPITNHLLRRSATAASSP